jgi:mannose-6-phosphate isomerase-like protein (cupin superfamily)
MPRNLITTLISCTLLLSIVAMAQEPPDTLSATDILKAEIEAVLNSPDGGVDRQVRVVDTGHSQVAIGILHRGPVEPDGNAVTGFTHSKVTEVYYVVSGSGTLTTGGTLLDVVARPPDSDSVTILAGPGASATTRDGYSRQVSVGDIIVIPAGLFHGWQHIEDHVTYLSIRPDPDRVLPAGYINPALQDN